MKNTDMPWSYNETKVLNMKCPLSKDGVHNFGTTGITVNKKNNKHSGTAHCFDCKNTFIVKITFELEPFECNHCSEKFEHKNAINIHSIDCFHKERTLQ